MNQGSLSCSLTSIVAYSHRRTERSRCVEGSLRCMSVFHFSCVAKHTSSQSEVKKVPHEHRDVQRVRRDRRSFPMSLSCSRGSPVNLRHFHRKKFLSVLGPTKCRPGSSAPSGTHFRRHQEPPIILTKVNFWSSEDRLATRGPKNIFSTIFGVPKNHRSFWR